MSARTKQVSQGGVGGKKPRKYFPWGTGRKSVSSRSTSLSSNKPPSAPLVKPRRVIRNHTSKSKSRNSKSHKSNKSKKKTSKSNKSETENDEETETEDDDTTSSPNRRKYELYAEAHDRRREAKEIRDKLKEATKAKAKKAGKTYTYRRPKYDRPDTSECTDEDLVNNFPYNKLDDDGRWKPGATITRSKLPRTKTKLTRSNYIIKKMKASKVSKKFSRRINKLKNKLKKF